MAFAASVFAFGRILRNAFDAEPGHPVYAIEQRELAIGSHSR
jgi:hypothetical protein